jgi:hypothetical protein
MSTPKGPPNIKSLDFSQFHPLNHTVWACRDYPGGRRRHLTYRWDFQWRHRVRAWTLCRVGRHDWTQWYRGRDWAPAGVTCSACDKDQPPTESQTLPDSAPDTDGIG